MVANNYGSNTILQIMTYMYTCKHHRTDQAEMRPTVHWPHWADTITYVRGTPRVGAKPAVCPAAAYMSFLLDFYFC